MNQEIIDRLHTVLYAISPISEDRERIIAEMGETIWLESLEKMLNALPEVAQKEVISLLNAGDLDKAEELFETNNIDSDAILSEVSASVMDEVMSTKVNIPASDLEFGHLAQEVQEDRT